MAMGMFRASKSARRLALAGALLFSVPAWAGERIDPNEPEAVAMTVDALFARPVLLATTVVGSAVWLVGLPFSALGDNVKESADALIGVPARATFQRCLGCKGEPRPGYLD